MGEMGVSASHAASRLLNYRSPAQVFDLEQSTQTQHESRYAPDQVLRDRHCDQNENLKIVIPDFAYRRISVALSVHKFGEVVRTLFIFGLECKIYFSRNGESVAHCVVFPKKIGIR